MYGAGTGIVRIAGSAILHRFCLGSVEALQQSWFPVAGASKEAHHRQFEPPVEQFSNCQANQYSEDQKEQRGKVSGQPYLSQDNDEKGYQQAVCQIERI
jgi:hypothetical protein